MDRGVPDVGDRPVKAVLGKYTVGHRVSKETSFPAQCLHPYVELNSLGTIPPLLLEKLWQCSRREIETGPFQNCLDLSNEFVPRDERESHRK